MTERCGTKFGTIEVGRGVAASLVVFHHAGSIISEPRFYGAEPFAGHLRNFNVGVDFFFVLSGFIIAWVHWNDVGDRSRIGPYAVKRFLRIYPPYWGVLWPLIALYLIFPTAGMPSQRDPLNIVMSLLLLPNDSQPVLGVAWTLVHEIFFYLLFAIIIAIGRKGLWLLAVWAIAIVVGRMFTTPRFPQSFLFSPFNLEFVFGVAGALLLKHRTVPFPAILAAAGILIFVFLMLFAVHVQDQPLIGRLAFGVSTVLFVLGIVELERGGIMPLCRGVASFGAASYAIYLIHPVVLSFSIHALNIIGHRVLPLSVAAVVVALAAIGAGVIYHRTIEPVLTTFARNALSRLTIVWPRAPVTGFSIMGVSLASLRRNRRM